MFCCMGNGGAPRVGVLFKLGSVAMDVHSSSLRSFVDGLKPPYPLSGHISYFVWSTNYVKMDALAVGKYRSSRTYSF